MASNFRPSGVFDTRYAQDMALNRTRGDKILNAVLIVALLSVPLLTLDGGLGLNILPQSLIGTIMRIAILVIAVQGLNLLTGYTGLTSLGHASFMAVGAYSGAALARNLGLPFILALPSAALISGVIGLMFGLPSLRVKGFYLSMATLAAQFIIPWALRYPLADISNGSRPLEVPIPELFGINLGSDAAFYYVAIPLSLLAALAARNLMRTRTGRALISVRDNDLAAELLGINVFAYKLQAFFLSAVFAGIAGCLLAFQSNSISLEFFGLDRSIEMLAMLIIGGAGFPLGPLLGVAFVNLLTQNVIPSLIPVLYAALPGLLPFLNPVNVFAALNPLLFGFSLMVFLIVEPRGLAYRWEIFRIAWKLRPYSY
jgi:branched-chain amino acid transport system permease protein